MDFGKMAGHNFYCYRFKCLHSLPHSRPNKYKSFLV